MAAVTVIGAKPIEDYLDRLSPRDRRNTMRRGVRAAGKAFVPAMRTEAAAKGLPHTFQKVAVTVSTHGSASGGVTAYVRPKSPLFNILEPGAKEHEIAPRHAAFLSNFEGRRQAADKARSGIFFSGGPVEHPGFEGRPISPAAFAAAQDKAMAAFADVVMATADSSEES